MPDLRKINEAECVALRRKINESEGVAPRRRSRLKVAAPVLPLPKIPGGRYYEEFLKLLSTLTTDNLVDRADCDAIMNDTYLLNHFRNMQKQYS